MSTLIRWEGSQAPSATPTRRFPRVKAYLLALTLGIVATTVVLRRRQKALDTA
jgi:hypothetical protein